jgi:hypothetical protein
MRMNAAQEPTARVSLIVGNLYSWHLTPERVNICARVNDKLIMIRLNDGEVIQHPDSDYNRQFYIDVTNKFYLREG